MARAKERRPWYEASALKHKAADKACGREWVCACGPCRTMRGDGLEYRCTYCKRALAQFEPHVCKG